MESNKRNNSGSDVQNENTNVDIYIIEIITNIQPALVD